MSRKSEIHIPCEISRDINDNNDTVSVRPVVRA